MPGADTTPPLELLISTVRAAGKIALSFHRTPLRHWHKHDGTTVTEADIAVDTYLRETLTQVLPQAGWLSEETPDTAERLASSALWIADPIDGTRDFLAGGIDWGIGVALVVDGKPTQAVLLCPAMDVLYTAEAGSGAFKNGEQMVLPAQPAGNGVVAPRSCATALRALGMELRDGSSLPLLLRLAAIAEGRLAGAVSLGAKNDWDIAAGHLLLHEAGGRVSTAAGAEIIYNGAKPWQPGLAAAQAGWHDRIVEAVRHT